MKAFEKWRDRQEEEGIEQGYRYGNREGWRAALGWFYDQLGHSEEHEELKDLIEKELEDK